MIRWHVIPYQTKKLYKFSVCILYPVCRLQSAFYTDRIGIAVFVRTSLKSGPKILELEKKNLDYLNRYDWCVDCMLKSSRAKAQWKSNDYFIPTEDERKCAAYALPRGPSCSVLGPRLSLSGACNAWL